MKDKERIFECKTVDLFIAVRRKKDNNIKDMEWRGELCFRRVIRNEVDDLAYMRTLVSRHPGVWRIYKTVNKRSVEMARKMLITKLVNEPTQWNYRVDSLWKTCLLNPLCKAERKYLIDFDFKSNDLYTNMLPTLHDFVKNVIEKNGLTVHDTISTPNGIHFVVDKFDTRILEGLSNDSFSVEFKRDAYSFVEIVNNDN